MAKSMRDTIEDAWWSLLAIVMCGGLLLIVGYFLGFRPIEWVMDMSSAAQRSDTSSSEYRASEPVTASEPVEQAPPAPPQESPERWECVWDPTMNENWHDDVLCQKGFGSYDRPLLLTGWDFVTYDDMMAAAADYEDQLNRK